MAVTDARPLSPRQKWIAVGLATVLELVSFWSIIAGVVRSTAEEGSDLAGPAAGMFALGFALVPFAFLVLAFGTNNPRAAGATLRAMGFWAVLGLPLMLFVDSATGMTLGFGLGAIPAIRLEPEGSWKARLWWVLGLAGYVFVLVATDAAPGPGTLSASLLPFVTVAFADWAVEQMREGRASRETGQGA